MIPKVKDLRIQEIGFVYRNDVETVDDTLIVDEDAEVFTLPFKGSLKVQCVEPGVYIVLED